MKLMPREQLYSLPEREREAVRALEWHLDFRARAGDHDPVDLDADGRPTTFITNGHFQRCLRGCGAAHTGRDFASECLAEILPRLGLLADTGRVKKPAPPEEEQARRNHFGHDSPAEGGQSAQVSLLNLRWWRVFLLPTLPALRETKYGSWLDGARSWSRKDEASLFLLFRRQDLVRAWRPRRSFSRGSVQWAFQQTGPP